jgi:hypothetical protein
VDDNDTTTYASGTLVAGTFNASGGYIGSTATGAVASSTHYSGKIAALGAAVTTVTLNSKASSTNNYYVGMQFNIVGGSTTGTTTISKGLAAYVTAYNGTTKVATLADKDGNPLSLTFSAGDIYSIGDIQSNEIGNVSGIFYLFGGYFQTGERIFRLDNRVVTQTATEFLYSDGTETTFAEAKFVAQGLLQKSQTVEFSASFDSASQVYNNPQTRSFVVGQTTSSVDNTPRSSGCCVVATALESSGVWEATRKQTLETWCEDKLHDTMLGECFRRGYQVIASKIGVPILKGESKLSKYLAKYYVWSWNNGTNMVMGKKFDPVSIPNSLVWITGFMAVGAIVSKQYAEKTWKSLYK